LSTIGGLEAFQRFVRKFAPSAIDFSGTKRMLIQKDLQPRDRLLIWYGLRTRTGLP